MCWEFELLGRYFKGEALVVSIGHARAVAALAVNVCHRLGLAENDCRFVEEAALLHDIGVCRIHAPRLGLHGELPYIMHGVVGREILEAENLPLHALVCERHIGVGITVSDIVDRRLPLPQRDMIPLSLPEQIVCFADLFFSKNPGKVTLQKSTEQVRSKLAGFGDHKVQIFDEWLVRFGPVHDKPAPVC
ncbi:MAG: HD domain-containing protein [Geobacteraceae bacterium]|nr:HD domain-containing protein [Geobacteraceae bacterium]